MSQQRMRDLFDKVEYEALKRLIKIESSKSTDLQIEGLIYQSRMMYMVDKMVEGQNFVTNPIG